MTDPQLQEGKYDWMDPEKAVKPVGSASKLNQGEEAGECLFEIRTHHPVKISPRHSSIQRNKQKCRNRFVNDP